MITTTRPPRPKITATDMLLVREFAREMGNSIAAKADDFSIDTVPCAEDDATTEEEDQLMDMEMDYTAFFIGLILQEVKNHITTEYL